MTQPEPGELARGEGDRVGALQFVVIQNVVADLRAGKSAPHAGHGVFNEDFVF